MVTVYPVTAEPPSLKGAVKLTVASLLLAAAVGLVGAVGMVQGTTGIDAVPVAPRPALLRAVTVST